MTGKFSSCAATVALSIAVLLSGCKSSTPTAPTQTLNSDGTVSQTAPATTAASPSPAPASAPAVQPEAAPNAPPPPTTVTATAGTPVAVTVTERLSASHNEVGDRFTGVLAEPLRASAASGGGWLFPRGTRVAGTVVAAKGRGHFKGAGALGIELTSIGGTPVKTSEYEKEQSGKGKRSAGFIGGGAGGGALIGGLAGGGKGALIGGLLGAGAGTAGAAFTGNKDVVIDSESRVTFRLRAPVTITVQPKG